MEDSRFGDCLTNATELRHLVGEPGEVSLKKELDHLDEHMRAFIALSPYVLVGTHSREARCDVSPRGDAPGFVAVLDSRTLLVPERPGNRRVDSLRNIIETGRVGLLFLVPGRGETLRVNGRASVIRDAEWLERLSAQGKTPQLAVAVSVEECFLHCAKSIMRSKLWSPDAWPRADRLPSLAKMILDANPIAGESVESLDAKINEAYCHLY